MQSANTEEVGVFVENDLFIQPPISLFSPLSQKAAERNYNHYLKCLNGKSLNEYFDIPFPKFELRKITNMEYEFKISHVQIYNLVQLQLPEDIIKLIKEYAEIGFLCKYNICFTNDTPFRAPLWRIKYYKNLNVQDNNIWNMLEKKHNKQYKHDWSPTISIEKDILYFIERLLLTLHKINIA
jgi:hypothetical protein